MSAISDYIAKQRKANPNLRIGSLHEIAEAQKFPPMPTGNPVADYVTSIGGLPRGVVTELRGQPSAGKTTLAAQIAAQHQKRVREGKAEGAILYLDFENAVSPEYFAALGLDCGDPETFVYVQPDTLEEGMNIFLEMTKEGLLALGVVDSVAAASAEAEFENKIGKASIGLRARAFHQALRMVVGPMRVTGTSLILINHTQQKIPNTFAEKQAAMRGIIETVSPGGRAIEYYTSLRLDLSKPSLQKTEAHDDLTNEKTKQVTSTEVIITAFKNKVGVPHRSGKMRTAHGRGFNRVYSCFHILTDHNLIKKKAGGNFTFPEQLLPPDGSKVPVGEANIIAAIEADKEWEQRLVDVASKFVLSQTVDQKDVEEIIVTDEFIDEETGEVTNV